MAFALLLPMTGACAGTVSVEQTKVAESNCCSGAQLLEDLQFLQSSIARVHPDVNFSAEPTSLANMYRQVQIGVSAGTSSREQAWLVFSRLNPIFNDAHLFVGLPDRSQRTKDHLKTHGNR